MTDPASLQVEIMMALEEKFDLTLDEEGMYLQAICFSTTAGHATQ